MTAQNLIAQAFIGLPYIVTFRHEVVNILNLGIGLTDSQAGNVVARYTPAVPGVVGGPL
ncbi:hypothetical protein IB279_17635 [Ensifer sp. ENS06]|uniref:hypothetical protein n=1 Tax=Ensifer sp. ENS06 TaxID=2769276 RepID=UPI00178245CA|nr:hypothetical protein [Ensifer sp. ENS06]MBD9624765.1 hypothetical protein [Ensifer sp. ENS06]